MEVLMSKLDRLHHLERKVEAAKAADASAGLTKHDPPSRLLRRWQLELAREQSRLFSAGPVDLARRLAVSK